MTEKKTEMYWLATDEQGVAEIVVGVNRPQMISQGGKYGITSRGYDSKEELYKDEGLLDTPCKECGGVIKTNYLGKIGQTLKEKGLCFSCNHWVEIMEDKDNPRRHFVKGVSYWRKDYRNLPSHEQHVLGFSGSVFKVKTNSGEEYTTNDMWCNGNIPERFKDRLPDNAIFLK